MLDILGWLQRGSLALFIGLIVLMLFSTMPWIGEWIKGWSVTSWLITNRLVLYLFSLTAFTWLSSSNIKFTVAAPVVFVILFYAGLGAVI